MPLRWSWLLRLWRRAMTWSRVKPRSQVHGSAHDKERKRRASLHEPTHPCVRCGHPLGPMGPHLHLDHHDYDKTRYLGFSHGHVPCPMCGRKCNLRAGSLVGNATQKARRRGASLVRDSVQRWTPGG